MDTTALTQALDAGKQWYIGWGCLSLILAGIAQGKNRSGFGWFIGGLIFGPLALFCLVIADKLPHER